MPTSAFTMSEEIYTVQEAAERLRVSPATVYRMVEYGELPSFKARGVIRIRKSVVDALIMGDTGKNAAVRPDEDEPVA